MILDIVVTDAAGGGTRADAQDSGGTKGKADGTTAASRSGPDLSADFTSGRQPRSAALPAAATGKVHKVELHVRREKAEVAPGVEQQMWTFGGTAPGPTLRGRVGDVFEVTLVNDDRDMGQGRTDPARALAVVSLVGSLGVVLLATALPAT
ncbi:hypothetical protein [Streptomyces sp. 891-h]|uniref:hypothetical protein n=1 Tax=Streptomyces sp. 891-h TaxID=2720714 RepID=UPI001FAA7BD7|nr:hypothetical protein [Streptomyces sp. 891-h]UNZ22262.1 multicopper oxidase domain-containing protein [Streptomyces sp. 891-h]